MQKADPENEVSVEELVQVAALLFGRPADLAEAFAGMKAGGLVLKPLDFLRGRNVDIVFDGFRIGHPVVQ